MQRFRFGIIGIGNIAPVHAAAIQGTPGGELVAIATRNPERGKAFADQHGAAWYADYRELLARSDIDAVTLCTPHDLHLPMTLAAAESGKHVLCEKPMALTVAECDEMIQACQRAGTTLGVVFQGRFEPLAVQLKAAFDAHQLGELVWVSANTVWYRSDEYYKSGPWRGTWAHEGGGVVINQAIHAIDLLQWLAGRPRRVTAKARTLHHSIEVEDAALALLEYPGGRLGLIQATTAAFPGSPERLEFYGTRGSVIYHKGQGRLEWHTVEPREDRVVEAAASSGAAAPMDITASAHTAQFQDFVEAVRDTRPPRVDGREGRKSIELVEAIYRSARLDAPVELPLDCDVV